MGSDSRRGGVWDLRVKRKKDFTRRVEQSARVETRDPESSSP